MEFCDTDLEKFVNGGGKIYGLLNWPEVSKQEQIRYVVTDLMRDVLSGLVFIHSQNEVHRDLSPQNCTFYRVPN